jgi:hypothetical protein
MRMHEPASVRNSTFDRKEPHTSPTSDLSSSFLALNIIEFLERSPEHVLGDQLFLWINSRRQRGHTDPATRVVAHSTPHILACSVD